MAQQIPMDWDALETAVERNSPDTESFLDKVSGQVITIVQGDPEAALLKRKVAENIHNFVRVEPASSREQYRWMERFVSSVSDDALRERLVISIDGKGAFRRFKDVLLAYPAERERWFTYRADLLHWHIHNWLADHELAPQSEPPWGEAQPPPELEVVEAKPVAAHAVEPPGEALRRRARELINGITAIDLPSAIAFLEFLRERGAAALTEGQGDEPDAAEPAAADRGGESDDQQQRRAEIAAVSRR